MEEVAETTLSDELSAVENFEQEIDEVIEEEKTEKRLIDKFEEVYGKAAKGFFRIANPFKKFAFKTQCLMHRFINIQAIHILENEGFKVEANFYRQNIRAINEGATWIDQDFKSINHFFHHEEISGLFGFSDALTEAKFYEDKLIKLASNKNKTKSLFYLGVILHLTQDMTVPQHVNNKLLEGHRDYEQWILGKAWSEIDYRVKYGIIRRKDLDEYFKETAKYTMNQFNEFDMGKKGIAVYEDISKLLVSKAQRVTAGILLDYYKKYYYTFDEYKM